MRNPAILAASLAGQPLLMEPQAVAQYARLLGVAVEQGADTRSGMSVLIERAKRMVMRPDAERAVVADVDRDTPTVCLPLWMGEADAEGFGWKLVGSIAVIEVRGPLMAEGFYSEWAGVWYHGYDTLYQATEEALADARVKALFIRYNTPGGVVAPGLGEWAKLMRENRASAGGKPIWGFAAYAYSAGFWAISSGDQVVAARESGVGSIGAVITHCDASGALSKEGFTVEHFTFGKKKADGSPYVPLTDTARADITAIVQQAGRWFVADVLAGRSNLTEEAVLATEAGIFYGDSDVQALSGLANGLVDRVMTERAAFAALRDLADAQTPSFSPAASAASASDTKGTGMKRTKVLAGLKAAGLSAEDLAKVDATLLKAAKDDQEDDYDDGDDEDEEDDDNLDDDGKDKPDAPAAEAEAARLAAALPAAKAPDAETALAITGLPEAKGREALARTLAATPGMTLDSAKAALAAAPKVHALRPSDPPLSPSAAGGLAGTEAQAAAALAAQFKATQPGARRAKR